MTVQFVPRSTWYTGAPTNNNGTPRALLARHRPTITRHYTGSPPRARSRTDTPQDYMRWQQANALASGKSFEYNYVIPPRADGSAQVWEYAGTYQAAHSAGENDVAVGVLFAIGVANHPSYGSYDRTKPTVWEPLTDEMVEAYRWLRDRYLLPQGIVLDPPAQIEHRNMPGAATACPGDSVIGRRADLLAPYSPPADPPQEEPMVVYFKTDPAALTIWASSDGLNAVRLEQFTCDARGIDPGKVTAIPKTEADKYVYHAGLTSLSVR